MSKIKKYFAKKYVKNGLWLYLLQFFNSIFPLITLPYITRVLGSSQYGIFVITLNFVQYLQVVIEYGFSFTSTRKVAISKDNSKLNKIFTCTLYSRILLFVICIIVASVYYLTLEKTYEQSVCIIIMTICLVGYVINQDWLFQGKEDMKFISICNIISRTITTILVFLIVKNEYDLVLYALLYSISPLLGNVIAIYVANRKYQASLTSIKFKDILFFLRDGLFIFLTQFSALIFSAIGITFLGIFATSSDVGIFGAIQKIPYVLLMLLGPISQVLYPKASKEWKESYENAYKLICKVRRYISIAAIAISIFVAIFSWPITYIAFGSEYANYYYLLWPLLIWAVLGLYNNFNGIQTLVAAGYDKEYSTLFIISTIATIIFNIVLVFLFKLIGASIAPALSELLFAALLNWKIAKINKEKCVKTILI